MFPFAKNIAQFSFFPKPNLGGIASYPFGSYPKQQISDLVVLAVPFSIRDILSSVSKGVYWYGFNGKETDSETDLQDYGLRFYNPSYGKFLSVDPLSRDYPWLSPFDFVSNNPIENIEVDGRYYIRNVRPTNSHPSRAKQKDRNWVVMITDHRQMEELDRIAAIPFFGIAARLPLTMKRGLDPSFQYSLKEWAAFGVETILSLSGYSAIKNASYLGKAILKINRELVGLINNIVIDPEYTEILIDREAAERLANKGIGITTYEDGFIRGLEINENVVKEWKKNFQKEAGDKKLTENQLENMITKNLEKLMDDEKNKIKIEIKETIKKVAEEVKKNDSKK